MNSKWYYKCGNFRMDVIFTFSALLSSSRKLTTTWNVLTTFSRNFPLAKITTFTVFSYHRICPLLFDGKYKIIASKLVYFMHVKHRWMMNYGSPSLYIVIQFHWGILNNHLHQPRFWFDFPPLPVGRFRQWFKAQHWKTDVPHLYVLRLINYRAI